VRREIGWMMMLLLAAGLFPLSDARAEIAWEEVFFKANQAYRGGHFTEAIDGYLQLIRSGHGKSPVYYNIGNAYLKTDQLGRAIWAYERALLLTPRDPDLHFNLSHARDQTRDATVEPGGSMETIFFWLKSFSFNELFGCFAVLNILFWLLLCLRLFSRSEWLFYCFLFTVSLWFVAGLSFGLKYYRVSNDDRAVIFKKEAPVLAGPHKADTVLFNLHEGTVVHHERSEDGWSLIRVSEKNRGWIRTEAIGRISGDVPIPN